MKGLFITGTGTDVGKSVVTAALARIFWTLNGVNSQGCLTLKAVQTGAVADAALYANALCNLPHAEIPPTLNPRTLHHFALAASPHLAAASQGKKLSVRELHQEIIACATEISPIPILIEGSGGVAVPLNATETTLDLMQALNLPLVVVMHNTLGTLNHTILTIDALQQRGLQIAALVCTEHEKNTDERIKQDNIHFLHQYYPHIPLYNLPYMENISQECTHKQAHAQKWEMAAQVLTPLVQQYVTDWEESQSLKNTHTLAESVLAWDKNHLWHPYTSATKPLPVFEVSHTKGAYIYLRHKQAPLIDGMSSWWCAVHGYGHKELVQAAQKQVLRMSHVMFGGLTHKPAVEAAQKLLALLPQGFSRLFWADSGSVAVEVALKMALQYQQACGEKQRTLFLSPRGGYYGDTLGAMSVCDPINGMHTLFNHVLPQHIFIPRPQCAFDGTQNNTFDPICLAPLDEAFRTHGDRLAALILEPIVQGAGGMWFYDPRYIQHARKLCTEHKVLLIFDEIATGFGRTGKMFAAEWANVSADICSVGKALTGGFMSLAATVCTEDVALGICAQEHVFMHGPTFMGNALACAVASASMDIFAQSPWQENVLRIEQALKQGLATCASLPGVVNVRVLGAIGVVEMQESVNVAALQEFFVQNNVWIRPFNRLIYVMPPYIVSDADIEHLTSVITKAIALGVHKI